MNNFIEIEQIFSDLLLSSKDILSENDLREVQGFLDHGEYGIALETAVAIFEEEKKVLPVKLVSMIEELAKKMLIDPRVLLGKLPKSEW